MAREGFDEALGHMQLLKHLEGNNVELGGRERPGSFRAARSRDEDEDEALTAGPHGKRSSVRQDQNSDCTTICGSDKNHQDVRLGPEDSTVNINKASDKTYKLRRLTIHLSQTSLPSSTRITAGAAVYYCFPSIRNTSLCSQEGWLTEGPR